MKKLTYLLIPFLACLVSCKKLVETGTPQNQLTTDKIYQDTTSAKAALLNIYALFDNTIDPNYNKYMGVYTDELTFPGSSADNAGFGQSDLPATNGTVSNIWQSYYFVIYSCNLFLEQIGSAPNIPAAKVAALAAEAKFLRAYAYFYLVNSFGPVPLLLTTNVQVTAVAKRADTTAVYQQIVLDIRDAQAGLAGGDAGADQVRANPWAASAFLARIYLYQRNWAEAEKAATAVISSGHYRLSALPAVFRANSSETILSFWNQYGYINDGDSLIPEDGIPQFQVSPDLLASFEPGDLRKAAWVQPVTVTNNGVAATYYYPYKYRNNSSVSGEPEFLLAFRLSEQYLIRAEAEAQRGNVISAVQDLNVIRKRAGLPDLPASISKGTCLEAVNREWRAEFFMENGHRFLDLKRQGRLNAVMKAYKPTWTAKANLLPVPQNELTYDKNLTQNAGY